MLNNWKKYKLGDISFLRKDNLPPSKFNGENYIGLEHIGQGTFQLDGIGTAEDVSSNKSKFEYDDVLYGKIRPYFKKVYKPKFSGICSTDILVIRSKNEQIVSQDYLYQIIKTQEFTDKATETSTGTKMPRADWDSLSKYEITLPPLPEQQAIAEILSALDDKIELNLQTNKTLEEMANALYKHWFVDFGPFKNGKFINSELGMIPEGWEVKDLKDIAEIIMGQSPESKYYNEKNEGYPFHQGVSDYGLRFPTDRIFSTEGNRIAEKSDILFSVRAPVGKINIAKHKIILGRGLSAIRDKSGNNNFLFYSLKNQFKTIDSIGSGTVYNSVNKSDMEKIKILSPVIKEKTLFNDKVKDLDGQYLINDKENILLNQTRDYLLPKLISGQIRVKDVLKQKFLKDFASPNK